MDELAHAAKMRELVYAQLLSRALTTIARLGIPDLLAEGPRSAADLARQTHAHPDALLRVLKALTAHEILTEPESATFALTPLGSALRSDARGSALPSALLVADEVGATWANFARTVHTGESAFTSLYDATVFDYLENKPERRKVFDRSQAEGLELELGELLEHVDFTAGEPETTIVDVGGGDGLFLCRVLAENPKASGVVVDLPGTVQLATACIAERGMAGRCKAVAGDFFDAVPQGAGVYLLSHVLHDWNDDRCEAILRTCAAAMNEQSTLIVIDLLADGSRTAALMDLYMMSLFGTEGGCERNADQFEALIRRAGLRTERIHRLPSGMGAIVVRK